MAKGLPMLIAVMFAIIIVSLISIGIASYWGTSDWTWIAQENVSLVLLLMVLALAFITLIEWLKGKR
jgi:uncharacterized BrkB/YihY/UPF0761 family membrane protein